MYKIKVKRYGASGDGQQLMSVDNISNDAQTLSFSVSVDGSFADDLFEAELCFDDDSSVKWATMTEVGNVIEVRLKENTSMSKRKCYVYIYDIFDRENHAEDGGFSENVALLTLEQNETEYDLSVRGLTGDTYTLNEISVTNTSFKDILLNVEATGGSGRFFIQSVRQYTGEEHVTDGNTYRKTREYDKGVLFMSLSTPDEVSEYNRLTGSSADTFGKYLVIRNYGRIFLDEKNYYEATLMHRDCREIKTNVKVKYRGETRVLTLSASSFNFDYVKSFSDHIDISFGNDCSDYGYLIERTSESGWIGVVEHPTSIVINCGNNLKPTPRSGQVIVKSRDDESIQKTIFVTQSGAPNMLNVTCMSLFDSEIRVDGETENLQMTLFAYGPSRDDLNLEFTTDDPILSVDNINVVESDECTKYICTCGVNHDSGCSVHNIDITLGDDVVKTISVINETETTETEGWVPTLSKDGRKIEIHDDPETTDVDEGDMDMVTLKSSAYWCVGTLRQYVDDKGYSYAEVTFEKSLPNDFPLERKCRFSVVNANNTELHRVYEVTQEGAYTGDDGYLVKGTKITLRESL